MYGVSLMSLDAQKIWGCMCMVWVLGWLGYKAVTSKNASRLEWSVGIVGALLCLTMLDSFTAEWLEKHLGRYHTWVMGVLVDSLIVLMSFMKTKKELTPKEKIIENIKLAIAFMCFSYIFFYLTPIKYR